MENFEKMKTEDFMQKVNSLKLFDEFTDHMAELDEEYAEGENVVRKPLWGRIDTRQESDNRLCDYLNEYIGPLVPISEQEFSATSDRIRSLRKDMDAVSAIIDRWGLESYSELEYLWEGFELRPIQEWVERIVEQVSASKQEVA